MMELKNQKIAAIKAEQKPREWWVICGPDGQELMKADGTKDTEGELDLQRKAGFKPFRVREVVDNEAEEV